MHVPGKISTGPGSGFGLKSISALVMFSLLLSGETFAQLKEDFSDGDFTANPSWAGTTEDFRVNTNLSLQLDADAASTSWLSVPVTVSSSGNIEWDLFLKQSFAPSGANFGRVYLMSDQPDLTGSLNGYYLQFGEAGSQDAVELFRQSGTTRTSVCRATNGAIASAFALRLHVTRTTEGEWGLSIDYSGGSDFIAEASGTDATHGMASYFGILCTYTVSNIAAFSYDDIVIRTTQAPDTSPPRLLDVVTVDAQSLSLVFSEAISEPVAEDPQHYFVSPAPGHPASSTLLPDQRTVLLSFAEPFKNGYESVISVEGVADFAGNRMVAGEFPFLYFQPSPVCFKDIIVTEILADPTPSHGLPEAEFVEIMNRSNSPVDLSGWTFSDEVRSCILRTHILRPGEYLVLTSVSSADKFSSWGSVLAVDGFPSINNGGELLFLRAPQGELVDSVRFSANWYRDDEKEDGGWSLEIIDPENICEEGSNWIAAEADDGGTPGQENSVFARRPDTRGPSILEAVPLSRNRLLIVFSEKLGGLPSASGFTVQPMIPIKTVTFSDPTLTGVYLELADSINPGTRYEVLVAGVYDCPGNSIVPEFSTASFVLPESAAPGDIVVNEILFNPRPTGVDFIEVCNVSGKTISLKNWRFTNALAGGAPDGTVLGANLLLSPGEYRAFTPDPNVLKGEYLLGREENFVKSSVPALNDREGAVVLRDDKGKVMDSVYYAEGMHSPFLKDPEGVSLERISWRQNANEGQNWLSASSTSGFATPGYPNSNMRSGNPMVSTGEDAVMVDPEVISRDVPSQPFAQIRYRFRRGGFVANVRIIDPAGRTIRELAGNELLGAEGFFRWDGDLQDGSPARTGYYMVWFEVFDETGLLATFRQRVAVF